MNKIQKEDITLFADTFNLYECLRNKSFMVTGATGLIGSELVYGLIALNHRYDLNIHIDCLVRNTEKARLMFEEYEVTILNYDFMDNNECINSKNIDYVIHAASPTASMYFVEHPVETIDIALNGTRSVINYAMRNNVKSLVYLSSLECYGQIFDDEMPLTEEMQGYVDPLNVRSSYSMGKRMCECMCVSAYKEYGVPVKIARLAQTFGAGIAASDNRVFAQFAKSVIVGKDIILHTDGKLKRQYLYLTDAISGILYVLLKGRNGEAYNVANDETYISIKEMAEMICREFRPQLKVKHVEECEDRGYAPVTKTRMTSAKLEKLGWKPRLSLRDMYDRLIKSLVL